MRHIPPSLQNVLCFLLIFCLVAQAGFCAPASSIAPELTEAVSEKISPPCLKGLILDPVRPLDFHFVFDPGTEPLIRQERVSHQSRPLIDYFLTALAFADDDLWVNLNPREADRIMPDGLAHTQMGKVMLAQDYLLKQAASQLLNPKNIFGKSFWSHLASITRTGPKGSSAKKNDFLDKVWIVPDTVVVHEQKDRVYIERCRLRVMMEEDYQVLRAGPSDTDSSHEGSSSVREGLKPGMKKIFRQRIRPELESLVNGSPMFAPLRQVYHSFILAAWYKRSIKHSILNQRFSDRGQIQGFARDGVGYKERIYENYLDKIRQGVFDVIQEEYDPDQREVIAKRYFSGGLLLQEPRFISRKGAVFPSSPSDQIVSAHLEDSAMLSDLPDYLERISGYLNEMALLRPYRWPITRIAVSFISSTSVSQGRPFIAMATNTVGLHTHGEMMLIIGVLHKKINRIKDARRRDELRRQLNRVVKTIFMDGKVMEVKAAKEALRAVIQGTGNPFKDGTLYVNGQPCANCTKALSLLKLKEVVYRPYPDAVFVEKANRSLEPMKKEGVTIRTLQGHSQDFGVNDFFSEVVHYDRDAFERIQKIIHGEWVRFAGAMFQQAQAEDYLLLFEKATEIFLTAVDDYIGDIDGDAERFVQRFEDENGLRTFLETRLPPAQALGELQSKLAAGMNGSKQHAVVFYNEKPVFVDADQWQPYAGIFQRALRDRLKKDAPDRFDDRKVPSKLNRLTPAQFKEQQLALYENGNVRYIPQRRFWDKNENPQKARIVAIITLRKIGGKWHFLMGRRHDVEAFAEVYAMPSGYVNSPRDAEWETASLEQRNWFMTESEQPEEGRETILGAAARQLYLKTGIDMRGSAGIVARLNDMYRPHQGELFHFMMYVDDAISRHVPVETAKPHRRRFVDIQWVPVDVLYDDKTRSHPNAEWESVRRWLQKHSNDPNAEIFMDAEVFRQMRDHFNLLFHEDLLPQIGITSTDTYPAYENRIGEVRDQILSSRIREEPLGRLRFNAEEGEYRFVMDEQNLRKLGFAGNKDFRWFFQEAMDRRRPLDSKKAEQMFQINLVQAEGSSQLLRLSSKAPQEMYMAMNVNVIRQIKNEDIRQILSAVILSHGLQESRYLWADETFSPSTLLDEDVQLTLELLRLKGLSLESYLQELVQYILPGSLYMDGLYMEHTLNLAQEASTRPDIDPTAFPMAAVAVNRKTGEMIAGTRQARDLAHGPRFYTHGEIEALRGALDAGWKKKDTDIFISMESCIHCAASLSTFFTPRRVIFATIDPYNTHRGRGGEMMRMADIDTRYIPLASTGRRARRSLSEFLQSHPVSLYGGAQAYSFESMAHEIHWYLSHPEVIYNRILKLVKGAPTYYPDLKELTMLVMLYIRSLRLLPKKELNPWPNIVAINANHMNAEGQAPEHLATNHLAEIASMRSWFPYDDDFKVVLVGSVDEMIRVHDEIIAHKDTDLGQDGGIEEENIYVLFGNRLFSFERFYDLVSGGFDKFYALSQRNQGRYYGTMGSARNVNEAVIRESKNFGMGVMQRGINFKNGGGSNNNNNTMRDSVRQAHQTREELFASDAADRPRIVTPRINLIGQMQPAILSDDEAYFDHFIHRIYALITDMHGVGFFEGGAGSFDELFVMWKKGINVVVRKRYDAFLNKFRKALSRIGLEDDPPFWPRSADTAEEMLDILDEEEPRRNVFTIDAARKELLKEEMLRGSDFVINHPSSFVFVGTPVEGHRLWEGQYIPLFRSLVLELMERNQNVRLASPGLYKVARRPEVLGLTPNTPEDRIYGIFSKSELRKRNVSKAEIIQGLPQSFFVSDDLLYKALITNNTHAVVLFPGSLEVLAVFKYFLDSIQTGVLPQVPLILVGKEAYWQDIIDGFLDVVSKERNPDYNLNLFNEEVLRELVFFVDSKNQVSKVLDDPGFRELRGQGPKRNEAGEIIDEEDEAMAIRSAQKTPGGIDLNSDMIRWQGQVMRPREMLWPRDAASPVPTPFQNLSPRIYNVTPLRSFLNHHPFMQN
jgi:tRNA(Arg) A34 adenosine deaminase TadA